MHQLGACEPSPNEAVSEGRYLRHRREPVHRCVGFAIMRPARPCARWSAVSQTQTTLRKRRLFSNVRRRFIGQEFPALADLPELCRDSAIKWLSKSGSGNRFSFWRPVGEWLLVIGLKVRNPSWGPASLTKASAFRLRLGWSYWSWLAAGPRRRLLQPGCRKTSSVATSARRDGRGSARPRLGRVKGQRWSIIDSFGNAARVSRGGAVWSTNVI